MLSPGIVHYLLSVTGDSWSASEASAVHYLLLPGIGSPVYEPFVGGGGSNAGDVLLVSSNIVR